MCLWRDVTSAVDEAFWKSASAAATAAAATAHWVESSFIVYRRDGTVTTTKTRLEQFCVVKTSSSIARRFISEYNTPRAQKPCSIFTARRERYVVLVRRRKWLD